MAEKHSASDDNNDVYEIDNFQWSPPSSPLPCTSVRPEGPNLVEMGNSDEMVAKFVEMGFSCESIARAIKENNGANLEPELILETLFKYSKSSEASSSKSQIIDSLIAMGFSEESVIKAIQNYGEENIDETPEETIDEITTILLSNTKAEKLHEPEDEDITFSWSSDTNDDDDNLYSGLFSPIEEKELKSSHQDNRFQALIKMDYSRREAAIAIERCGENDSVADLVDFIGAAQMARQLDEFYAVPDEEPEINTKKRRTYNEPLRRERELKTVVNSADELIRIPNPMIGFGVPNEPGLLSHRPVPVPNIALGPPYFYYENIAMAPQGVWATISRHLYDILPEFVDSKYFCATARKRGYIHNLPVKNRFQIQPPPHYTIQEAFPIMKRWWPSWDERTKLNCLLTCIASAQLTNSIRTELEKYDEEPPIHVQKDVINKCKRWNLVWVGKNKVAPLEPDEMEKLLGFPRDHTRGGGISKTDRYKSLGNSFQVDTVAYQLSVLKPLFPNGVNVLSLFTGIGGAEVALYRLQIPMKVVVSVEISKVNQNIVRSFWEQTNQRGQLLEFRDVQELDNDKIEQLMDQYGGFDLVIGGSPCNNFAGGNRYTRNGLAGEQSSLFYDYCRILDAVRYKAAKMRR